VVVDRPDRHHHAVLRKRQPHRAKDPPDNLIATTAANVFTQLPDEGIDLEEVERETLREALEKHGWNQTRTAQYLDVTRSVLIYRMQKYGCNNRNCEVLTTDKYHLPHAQPNRAIKMPTSLASRRAFAAGSFPAMEDSARAVR
jgi:hypothetical protein